jgi:predicted patatin/cPLA2 family phospholipase
MSVPFYDLYCEEVEKNKILEKKLENAEKKCQSLEQRLNYFENNMAEIIQRQVEAAVLQVRNEYEAKIEKLEAKVASLQAIVDRDASVSGMSTSKTPIHKKKHVPNSREKSDKDIV